jgi:hypothetical protein
MADSYKVLARVANNQTEAYGSDLEEVANRQEANLNAKQNQRDVQKYYQQITQDEIVTFDELQNLHEMRSWIGSTDQGFWGSETVNEFEPGELGYNPWKYDASKYGLDEQNGNNSHFYLQLGDKESEEGRKTQQVFDNIKGEIENKIKDTEDVQSKDQFEIQMATSDLQNAESVRQQAYKKLDESRDKGTDAWGQG